MPLWPTLPMHSASPLASGEGVGRMSRSGVVRPAPSLPEWGAEKLRVRPGATPAGQISKRFWLVRSPASRCTAIRSPDPATLLNVAAHSPRNAPGFLSLSGASLPLRWTTGPVRLARAGRLTLELKRRPGIGAKPSRRTALLARCRLRERIGKLVAAMPKEENIAAVRRPPAGEPTGRAPIPPAAAFSVGRDCVAGVRWGLVSLLTITAGSTECIR